MREDYTVTPLGTLSTGSSLGRSVPSQEGSQPGSNSELWRQRYVELSPIDTHQSESSTSGIEAANLILDTFMGIYLEIDLILHKAVDSLYYANSYHITWREMRRGTSSLLSGLDEWAQTATLHQVPPTASTPLLDLNRKQLLLNFYHHSVMMTIARPCLRRAGLRPKEQSQRSIEFDQRTAEMCVNAVLGFTSLLPETPNPTWLYGHGSW